MIDGYDAHQLDELAQEMLKTALTEYPKEVKTFLRKEGNAAGKALRAEIRATTTRRSGDLAKSVKRGKVWKDKDGTWHVRAYSKKPYNIPVNLGHIARDKKTFVDGAQFFPPAEAAVNRQIMADVEGFLDDLLARGFAL